MKRGRARAAGFASCRVALAALALLAGCAAPPADDPFEPKGARDHAMAPYAMHEECLRVAAGERIEYYFTSTEPVDFNIHFHETRAVVMPIVRDRTRDDSGIYVARIAKDYCLAWEAGPGGASLNYRVRLRPPAGSM